MWTTKRLSPNTFEVHTNIKSLKGWSWRVLLAFDVHFDNAKCNRELYFQLLNEAKEHNAAILDGGDFFCAMQGKYDKRSSKKALRPEHQVDEYLDALVDTSSELLTPYAKQFAVFGVGNHETSIKKHHETDLTSRLITSLKQSTGANIYKGGYSYWVTFKFREYRRQGSGGNKKQPKTHERVVRISHGSGKGGVITGGMIKHSRRAMYLPEPDIIAAGHTHLCDMCERCQLILDSDGKVSKRTVTYLTSPSFKDGLGDGSEGWESEKEFAPQPLGGWWIEFYYCDREKNIAYRVLRTN